MTQEQLQTKFLTDLFAIVNSDAVADMNLNTFSVAIIQFAAYALFKVCDTTGHLGLLRPDLAAEQLQAMMNEHVRLKMGKEINDK